MKHFAIFMSFRMHALPKEGSASGLSFLSVQRLEEISPRIAEFAAYLPIVLIGSVEQDIELLEKREALIASGKHKGNTRESKEYKTFLPQECTTIQFEWAVGMILSDASLQYNTKLQILPSKNATSGLPLCIYGYKLLSSCSLDLRRNFSRQTKTKICNA